MVRDSLVCSGLQVLEVSRRDDFSARSTITRMDNGLALNHPLIGWPTDMSELVGVAARIHWKPNALTATSVPD
jgi:hypothetical protein